MFDRELVEIRPTFLKIHSSIEIGTFYSWEPQHVGLAMDHSESTAGVSIRIVDDLQSTVGIHTVSLSHTK